MSKFAPRFSSNNTPKTVQRLFFPKNGDMRWYSNCGRKHYNDGVGYQSPYALFNVNEQKQKKNAKYNQKQQINSIKYLNRYDLQDRFIQQQLNKQKTKYQLKKIQSKVSNYEKKRLNTQSNIYQFQYQNNQYPEHKKQINYSIHNIQQNRQRKRFKTQAQPGEVRVLKREPRFNPTYLSSINY